MVQLAESQSGVSVVRLKGFIYGDRAETWAHPSRAQKVCWFKENRECSVENIVISCVV